MRQPNECGLGHKFTCQRCPVCDPDELAIKRAEREYEQEREALELMGLEAFRHHGPRNRSAEEDPSYGTRLLEALTG